MSYLAHAQAMADIDDLVTTHELASRPARAPDPAAENRVLAALAQELARHPDQLPGRVAQVLRELCRCDAAGAGLPEQRAGGVDWRAADGEPVLLRDPARLFPSLRSAGPAPAEMLLLPWSLDGEPGSMLWVADQERRFDQEDVRLLRSLSGFAAAARRLAGACPRGEQARRDMERAYARRPEELHDVNVRLASETAQRTAVERELRASHAILDAAMHTEAVGLAIYTLDGCIIDCNEALERMSGYSREELRTSLRWTELGTPEFSAATQRALAELREGGRTAPYMKQLVRKDGSRWWAMVAPSCLPGEGEARKCIAFVIDVTGSRWIGMNIDVDARRQAEAALRESDGRFRVLAEASPALIFQLDEQGRVGYVNRRGIEMIGIQVGTTPEDSWGMRLHPDDQARFVEAVRAAIGGRSAFQQRVRARAADGRWHWFESHGAPLFGAGGAYRGHVGISIDVTGAVQAEDALRHADRRKDEFLATLAHELRHPLAPISNAVHLLRRPDGRRTADRMVEMVGRQVRQMVRLVDDLMDVSRITQGKLELRREQLALAEVLAMAVETSMPAIEAGRHDLTVSLPEETLMLEADKVRLTQVFGNLLNNAAKYTDRGGRIWLGAWREDALVAVSVRDTGIGIPAAKLPHVFEMFSQAHRDSGRGQAGLGIGLTMVRSLVELHGGSVEARSEGPGRGSEFIVRLPLAQAIDAAPQEDGVSGEAPLEGRRVLVVDDNGDAAESLALLLQSAGAEVRTAPDGPAGLEAAHRFAPHAVLLDLGMPGMDGFEVARRLRAEPELAGLVLVALTGWGQEEDRKRTRSSGFDHHLTKPVDVDGLMEILGKIQPAIAGRLP